jgi:hypothetical protein
MLLTHETRVVEATMFGAPEARPALRLDQPVAQCVAH